MKITLPENAQIKYLLLQKDEVLGRCYDWNGVENAIGLPDFSQDFPWFSYFFLTTEKFGAVKFLFDEELKFMDEKRWKEIDNLWEQIHDADLCLQNVETAFRYRICVPTATAIAESGDLEKSRFYTHIEADKHRLWFRRW